jgi:hypothetical protein
MMLAKLKKNNRYTLPDDNPDDKITYTIISMNVTGIKSKSVSTKDNKTVTKIIRIDWKAAMKIDVNKL